MCTLSSFPFTILISMAIAAIETAGLFACHRGSPMTCLRDLSISVHSDDVLGRLNQKFYGSSSKLCMTVIEIKD